ncbi:putative N-acetyltransferase HLS1-like [Cocos nucifera]|uniref:Putative N-acetyltransferase HLS1-like n=1 Tax=Cocos nucifera TaxID=13894 RepID=A0A8K0I5U9_COCNU|nr:putative N-acetyltransferase HLS1-like [Cocos nucifera]
MSSVRMGSDKVVIRSYDRERDRERFEKLERNCEFKTDVLGDPLCRIRNSPTYEMLVAELGNELVGVVCGSIKVVRAGGSPEGRAKVGYILGLRVSSLHRRRGIGSSLVFRMEQWFVANHVDYVYMATEKDNEASVKLFTDKLGFIKFRTPTILVNPVGNRMIHISSGVEIKKLDIEQAEVLYRKVMSLTEFFPQDIDSILANKLSLGTFIAYPLGETWEGILDGGPSTPKSWAMLSVWNSAAVFKLKVGRAHQACVLMSKASRWLDRLLPLLRIPVLPNIFSWFGFYFMYGLHAHGPEADPLMRSLCHHVHNMATKCKDCKLIVTEVGSQDAIGPCIPHWKMLSYSEDLWCIKALNNNKGAASYDWTKAPPPQTLFVDPREV